MCPKHSRATSKGFSLAVFKIDIWGSKIIIIIVVYYKKEHMITYKSRLGTVRVCACVRVCTCERACVCVCVWLRERERGGESGNFHRHLTLFFLFSFSGRNSSCLRRTWGWSGNVRKLFSRANISQDPWRGNTLPGRGALGRVATGPWGRPHGISSGSISKASDQTSGHSWAVRKDRLAKTTIVRRAGVNQSLPFPRLLSLSLINAPNQPTRLLEVCPWPWESVSLAPGRPRGRKGTRPAAGERRHRVSLSGKIPALYTKTLHLYNSTSSSRNCFLKDTGTHTQKCL